MKKISFFLFFVGLLLTQQIKSQTVNVNNFAEFETALKDINTTTINVLKSFRFTKNITNIPNRDVKIVGNKDQNVVIESYKYSIYGKQNTKSINTFTIENASIVGDNCCGRFFTGGAGNGPSSRGWDVLAINVDYKGARFVHLSEGTLTFDGKNDIHTTCENAWVHSLVFKSKSIYNGSAASTASHAAFYFNGGLVNGKTVGTVEIEDYAQVNIVISPNNNKYYCYPAFYDKVYKINVGNRASLNIDAAGVAIKFIARCDYLKAPSFNIGEEAIVKLTGRGGGNYPTVKLGYYKSEINVNMNAELTIVGYSCIGVVKSIYKEACINVYHAKLSIENQRPNSPIFKSVKTKFNFEGGLIYTWGKTGGKYDYPPTKSFNSFARLNTIIDKNSNGTIDTDNPTALAEFQVGNYGKISCDGSGPITKSIDFIEPISPTTSTISLRSTEDLLDENESSIRYSSQNGTLMITSSDRISSWEVYSIQGRLIIKEQINNTSASITSLTPGVYIIKTLVNGKIGSRKVIVK